MMQTTDRIFDEVLDLPDPGAQRVFQGLVGIDNHKTILLKEGALTLHPNLVQKWSKDTYGNQLPLVDLLSNRPRLFLFAGDVGTGKTALARSFGDAIARDQGVSITLYVLSINSRGSGAVGEMTTLISAAFREVRGAKSNVGKSSELNNATILLIDEADSLVQSRENSQMHHEDRAGVNAIIRGIDSLTNQQLPVLVVMCTNRLGSIDPAIRRRSSLLLEFRRPNATQRDQLLRRYLEGVGFRDADFKKLVDVTGNHSDTGIGYTYSDFTERFLPSLVINSIPNTRLTIKSALEFVSSIMPTPQFKIPDD